MKRVGGGMYSRVSRLYLVYTRRTSNSCKTTSYAVLMCYFKKQRRGKLLARNQFACIYRKGFFRLEDYTFSLSRCVASKEIPRRDLFDNLLVSYRYNQIFPGIHLSHSFRVLLDFSLFKFGWILIKFLRIVVCKLRLDLSLCL